MNDAVRIMGLGYLGVQGEDLGAWSEFCQDILGMGEVESTNDLRRFKMDTRHYRLAVHKGSPGLAYIGWEVQSDRALEATRSALEAAGVATKAGTEKDAAERGVAALFRCDDPSGNALEFFYGAPVQEVTRLNSRHDVRFVTGEQGMGHVVLGTSRYQEMVDFYLRVLNFEATDVLVGELSASFLGCNPRHHTLALLDTHGQADLLHHFMVEADDLNMVGQAYDRVLDQGLSLEMTLGRHWNDHMTSFYVQTPSDFSIEFGWGGRTIDRSTWSTVRGTGEISFWGHRPVSDALASLTGASVGEKP